MILSPIFTGFLPRTPPPLLFKCISEHHMELIRFFKYPKILLFENHNSGAIFCLLLLLFLLSLSLLELQNLIDPDSELGYPGVDSRLIGFCASDSPGDNSGQLEAFVVPLNDHGTTRITCKRGKTNGKNANSPSTSRPPIISPSQESYPPFFHPAQMKIFGMCSMYPADLYIVSQILFSITGTETSCNLLGNGPSSYSRPHPVTKAVRPIKSSSDSGTQIGMMFGWKTTGS